jgi:hypothetical protein
MPQPAEIEVIADESPFRSQHTPAVQRCIDAFNRVCPMPLSGKPAYEAEKAGRRAFRSAMPDLTTRENVRGFIACVGYGLLTEVFQESEAGRLLYAAQVALAAAPREPAIQRPSAS